jgi:hypothetical protein
MATVLAFSVNKTHIKQNLIFGGFFKKGCDSLLVI